MYFIFLHYIHKNCILYGIYTYAIILLSIKIEIQYVLRFAKQKLHICYIQYLFLKNYNYKEPSGYIIEFT